MTNESVIRADPDRRPTHPGAVLRDDVLPDLGLTVTAAAKALGITRQALHNVLDERAAISTAMALRIAKLCDGRPEIWLRMQQRCDLWTQRRALAEQLAKVPSATELRKRSASA